jgi:hypothetical protein
VKPVELLEALLALAAEAGIQVRAARADEPILESALCKLRGAWWIVLQPSDPLEHQISLVARTLRTHAADLVESRWLPPEVRERIGIGDGVN